MKWYEIEAALNGLEDKNKTSWEQTRMIAYITAQCNSTKKLKPTDLISINWDEETTSITTSISNDDIMRLKEKANQTLKQL